MFKIRLLTLSFVSKETQMLILNESSRKHTISVVKRCPVRHYLLVPCGGRYSGQGAALSTRQACYYPLCLSLSPAARKTTATAAQEASLTKLSQQKVAAAAPTYIRKPRGDRSSGVKAGVKTFSLTCSFGKADTHWMTSEGER